MNPRAVALLLMAACTAFGGDKEFDLIVRAIESHYGVHRTHIPLMGMANLFIKVSHPAGAGSFRLAVFEDLKCSPGYREWADMDRFITDTISAAELRPLVSVHSRREGESTYIFAGPVGKSTRMLIATFQRDEATLIEMKVSTDVLFRSIEEPERAGKTLQDSHEH